MAAAAKRKRESIDSESGSDAFVVQFTALMMIMLAFFILLTSIAKIDNRRKRLALGSLMGSFGILPSGVGLDSKGQYAPMKNPIMPGVRTEAYLRVMGTLFSGPSSLGKVHVYLRQGKIVISFRSDILFPAGISAVSPKAFGLLDTVGAAINTVGLPVKIEGHTDKIPGKSPLDNWRISLGRANAVLRYLRDGCNIAASKLSSVGYADTRPVAGKQQAAGPENRRVEIVFDRIPGVFGGQKSK